MLTAYFYMFNPVMTRRHRVDVEFLIKFVEFLAEFDETITYSLPTAIEQLRSFSRVPISSWKIVFVSTFQHDFDHLSS